MGVGYYLVNLDKQETIRFLRIPVLKMNEIAGSMAAASIVTWYMLNNRGDRIAFLSDHEDEYHLFGCVYKWREFSTSDYTDVTDAVVNRLLEVGILRDKGILWMDEDDSSLFTRDLRNNWDPKAQGN